MTARPWTMSELKVLKIFSGLGRQGVATLLNRTVGSVEAAAKAHNISLKCNDDDIEINAEVLDLLQRVKETPRLQVCPMCGRRWATMRSTGVCRPCHLDRLIGLHLEATEVEVRDKALSAARKEKQRVRRDHS